MFEAVITIITTDEDGNVPITAVFRAEFDTELAPRTALRNLEQTEGVTNYEQLTAN